MTHSLRYDVNCSMLLTELPLLERPAAAKAAGFDGVEFWWPWPGVAVPPDAAVDAFVSAVRDAGVQLVGLNFDAGDLAGADLGLVSVPARPFRDSVDVAVGIGSQLGCRSFNALYGVRLDDVPPEEQDELAVENLAFAARAVAAIDGTVMVEAVSGPKPYPLRTAGDVVAVLDRLEADNVGFLCDLYHLAINGDDLDAVPGLVDRIAHVQIADAPGRHEPGTGSLDLDGYLGRLERAGYDGWVGLEYKARDAAFDWLPRSRRGANRETV